MKFIDNNPMWQFSRETKNIIWFFFYINFHHAELFTEKMCSFNSFFEITSKSIPNYSIKISVTHIIFPLLGFVKFEITLETIDGNERVPYARLNELTTEQ